MGATYSPHRDGGGILHFPSPTHIHHGDPSSALVQLRRSLSRSPSKGPTFRLVTSKSASPSPSSPLSPSPLSPQHAPGSVSLLSSTSLLTPSPLATPFPPSARKNRSGGRRLSPPGIQSRSASLQRSPAKRALSDCTDNGNATPPSPIGCSVGEENGTPQASPEYSYKDTTDPSDSYFVRRKSDDCLSPHRTLGRRDRVTGYLWDYAVKSSPLKRSDGILDFDLTNPQSPSAKRRSLHGASSSPDFDIFDHEAAALALGQSEAQSNSEGSKVDPPIFLDHSGVFSAMPKRTSSLRKTTLQQRYEKPLSAKLKSSIDSTFALNAPGISSSKGRQRMSLDNALPPMPRDSPFSSQGNLPNASVHPISHQRKDPHILGPPAGQRHPLSRTITQSSSNSSLAEDSPTHVPIHHPEPRKPGIDFTKSLPVGSNRPDTRASAAIVDTVTNTSSSSTSFATPENYKLAKPLPAAFMSTGLISKRNKDINVNPLDFKGSLASMPDTPCKRPTSLVSAVSGPGLDSAISKPRHGRHSLHSFGTPSTPFNPHVARPSLGNFAKGSSIFGSSFGNGHLTRRGSFVSIDGEDTSLSPSGNPDSQSSTDQDIPPTPTKQVLGSSLPQPRSDFANGRIEVDPHAVNDNESLESSENQSPQPEQCCKSTPTHTPGGSVDGDSDSVMEDSPSTTLRFKSLNAITSFSKRPQFLGHARSPTPLSRKSLSVTLLHSRNMKAKPSPLSPASPRFDRIEPKSPQTPQGSMLPPDPSGLSISARGDGHPIHNFNRSSLFLPATPTTSRDQISLFGKSRTSLTPVHGPAQAEADACLISKFGKVEIIGTGEFSQVYRVTQKANTSMTGGYFSQAPSHGSPKTPMPSQVWAVKKALRPFIGPKDRQRKVQEVEILKKLGRADHTVELVESWEENNYLYIQTELCEEGSLDLFLDQVGRKARLDDFRIWKIMLELSLGLKHIHDSGFIHLDLKPANVLITFEGVLKIGDFGMATSWPAPPGIDGEGDREYIGPEILMGQFDKPADIFALGLIMLEIAGNVMLPDNGASWQRLRSGDMSDVPSLTSSSEASNVLRDSSGKPLSREESFDDMCTSNYPFDGFGSPSVKGQDRRQEAMGNPRFQLLRCGELPQPPSFMVDPDHEEALDKMVRWMISPDPINRPVIAQILGTGGVRWTETRRRAGATIYEGNWGPADEILQDDEEMIDV